VAVADEPQPRAVAVADADAFGGGGGEVLRAVDRARLPPGVMFDEAGGAFPLGRYGYGSPPASVANALAR